MKLYLLLLAAILSIVTVIGAVTTTTKVADTTTKIDTTTSDASAGTTTKLDTQTTTTRVDTTTSNVDTTTSKVDTTTSRADTTTSITSGTTTKVDSTTTKVGTTTKVDATTTKVGTTTKVDATSTNVGTSTTHGDPTTTTKYSTSSKVDGTTTTRIYSSTKDTTSTKTDTSTSRTDTTKTDTSTTRYETTTTKYIPENCWELSSTQCLKNDRCALLVVNPYGYRNNSDCDGKCAYCVDPESYGSCEYYRKYLYSTGNKYILGVYCNGDDVNFDYPACYGRDKCFGYGYEECLEHVNSNGAGCVWGVSGDECTGQWCGYCYYAVAPCEKHKKCSDSQSGTWSTTYYCDVNTTDVRDCEYTYPTCDYSCNDASYSDCVANDQCVWINVENFYYYNNDNCPDGCGYCQAACGYGGSGTCEDVKYYYECRSYYGVYDHYEDSTTKATWEPLCASDDPPSSTKRCYRKDSASTNAHYCAGLDYKACMNDVAVDDSGGCAWEVDENCYTSCGKCVDVFTSCQEHKKCNDYDSRKDGTTTVRDNNWYSTTFYCGDVDPDVTDCKDMYAKSRSCETDDIDTCLKGGSDGHCIWREYRSYDNVCGKCDYVCDSCTAEQKRMAAAYGSGDNFLGADYRGICKVEDNAARTCYNCYGWKSSCANDKCADEVRKCNADDTCRAVAYKHMCYNYEVDQGSQFYEALVRSDSSNEALKGLATCMKQNCFKATDSEIIYNYDDQTTLYPKCDFGYALFDAVFEICFKSISIAELCKYNYYYGFRRVVNVYDGAQIYWSFPDANCDVFQTTDKVRRLESATSDTGSGTGGVVNEPDYSKPQVPVDNDGEKPQTTVVENPWDDIKKSTQVKDPIEEETLCLKVEITVSYPTKELYESDKDKYNDFEKNAYKLVDYANVNVISYSLDCCHDDEVCQDTTTTTKGAAAISSLIAIVSAISAILFL